MLTVALYPVYDWMVGHLGGRRRLAAVLLTVLSLLIVDLGPATWLTLGLVDCFRNAVRASRSVGYKVAAPARCHSILAGSSAISIYQFWDLASTNFRGSVCQDRSATPKPFGAAILLRIAEGAGIGAVKFFIAIIVAGFLFSPAPSLVHAVTLFSRRLRFGAGRAVRRLAAAHHPEPCHGGVVGVSALQALLAGRGSRGGRNSGRQPDHLRCAYPRELFRLVRLLFSSQ